LNVAAGLVLISAWQYRIWLTIAIFALAWVVWASHVGKDAIKAWWGGGSRKR